MTIKQIITEYMAAHPKAKPKEVALACKCSVHTVYNFRASLKTKPFPKPKAYLIRSEAKLLAEREREIKGFTDTTNLLLQKIEKLTDDNYLYVKRELKLLGVIDYLESKVKHAASV